MTVRLGGLRRGVAQPGRAPGSGPGGRRFKSSLPDHLFQSDTNNFWFAALSGVGDFEVAKASKINKRHFCWVFKSELLRAIVGHALACFCLAKIKKARHPESIFAPVRECEDHVRSRADVGLWKTEVLDGRERIQKPSPRNINCR